MWFRGDFKSSPARSLSALIIFLVSVFYSFTPAYSQTVSIGVHIDQAIDFNSDVTKEAVVWLQSIGVEIIQIDGIQSIARVSDLSEKGFRLWIGSGIAFLRSSDVEANPERLTLGLLDPLRFYTSNRIPFERYIVTSHPSRADTVQSILSSTMRSVSAFNLDLNPGITLTPKEVTKFGIETSQILFAINDAQKVASLPNSSTIYILPGSLGIAPLRALRDILELASRENHTLIFPLSYLSIMQLQWPESQAMISMYSSDPAAAYPLDRPTDSSYTTNIPALLFIIGSVFFLILLANNGSYLRAISRYLFTHNFYVNDVLYRRIKSGSEIPISFLVTGVFSGLLMHVVADALSNELVHQMLAYHAPLFSRFLDTGSPIPFLSGFIVFAGLQLLMAGWLFVSLAGQVSPGQILQLIQPPAHFILPVSSIITIFHLNGLFSYSHIMAGILSCFFIFIIFFIVSIDIYMNLQNNRGLFLLAGPILFGAILSISIWYLLTATPLIENINLIVQMMD
jgi:hypothetical protein